MQEILRNLKCFYHKNKIINNICLENYCADKAICHECQADNHDKIHQIMEMANFEKKLNRLISQPDSNLLYPSTTQDEDLIKCMDGVKPDLKLKNVL